MSLVAHKPSLRVVHKVPLIVTSYNEKIAQRVGEKPAILVEWIRYNCEENQRKGGEFSVYQTLKSLAKVLRRSMPTMNRYLVLLKEEGVITIGKDYDHNCRQNTYTLGQRYYDIVNSEELSSSEYNQFSKEKDQSNTQSLYHNDTNSISQRYRGLSHNDQAIKIYNIYNKNIKHNAHARGPDVSDLEKNVIKFPINAQEAPPTPPPIPDVTPPDPIPFPEPKGTHEEKKDLKKAKEDKDFETEWAIFRKGAKTYGSVSIGSKGNARRAYSRYKSRNKISSDESRSKMERYFEWKENLTKQGVFCETPPHLQKYYNQDYSEDASLKEFIESSKPRDKEPSEDLIKNFDPKSQPFFKCLLDLMELKSFNSWFSDASFKGIKDGVAYLEVRSNYFKDKIPEKFSQEVEQAMKAIHPEFKFIEYVVKGD